MLYLAPERVEPLLEVERGGVSYKTGDHSIDHTKQPGPPGYSCTHCTAEGHQVFSGYPRLGSSIPLAWRSDFDNSDFFRPDEQSHVLLVGIQRKINK